MTIGPLAATAPAATGLVVSAKLTPAGVYQQQAIEATNAQRTKNGLAALKYNSCLQRYAARQATNMAKQRRMYHQNLKPIIKACNLGYGDAVVGENVAYGQTSGAQVVRAWMNSAGHRANILNPQFNSIGLAARQSSSGRWYVSQVFGRAR